MKDRCVDDIIVSRTWQLGGGEAVTKEQVDSLPRCCGILPRFQVINHHPLVMG